MEISTDRILVTHVGSLPRPDDLLDLLRAEEQDGSHDVVALRTRVTSAVAQSVARQTDAGIDVVSDGEMSKIAYTVYVKHRLDGTGPLKPGQDPGPPAAVGRDLIDHPDYLDRINAAQRYWVQNYVRPYCVGPVVYGDRGPLERDIANLHAAVEPTKPVEAFMNAADCSA